MKITQTQDTMSIEKNGAAGIILGVILGILGGGMIVLSRVKMQGFTGDPLLLLLVGIALAFGGALATIFASSMKVTMQKNGETTVTKHRLIGGKEASQSFPTTDITAVNLTVSYNRATSGSTNGMPQPQSALSLMLKNGSMLQVGSRSGRSGFSVNIGGIPVGGDLPLTKEAKTIADFLGVQLINTNPLTMVQDVLHMGGSTTPPQQTSSIVPPVATPSVAPPVAMSGAVPSLAPVVTEPQPQAAVTPVETDPATLPTQNQP